MVDLGTLLVLNSSQGISLPPEHRLPLRTAVASKRDGRQPIQCRVPGSKLESYWCGLEGVVAVVGLSTGLVMANGSPSAL